MKTVDTFNYVLSYRAPNSWTYKISQKHINIVDVYFTHSSLVISAYTHFSNIKYERLSLMSHRACWSKTMLTTHNDCCSGAASLALTMNSGNKIENTQPLKHNTNNCYNTVTENTPQQHSCHHGQHCIQRMQEFSLLSKYTPHNLRTILTMNVQNSSLYAC